MSDLIRDKILFLDYDGVLCHRLIGWLDKSPTYWNQGHDKTIIRALARIQEDIGIKYVTCSRAHTESSKKEQEAVFHKYGHHLDFHDDYRTPYSTDYRKEDYQGLVDGFVTPSAYYKEYWGDTWDKEDTWDTVNGHRGMSIASWLRHHPEIGPNDYLVIDDERDMWPIPKENFIHVVQGEMRGGLNIEQIVEIYKFFGVEMT